MRSTVTVTPARLPEVLLHVAVVRPVFLWGAPGIGKSSLVRNFAAELGLECVTLLGTQLAPEDLIGVPELVGGRSRFAPPESIARHDPYCLFLDELNASSPEVQKAFYSLILDRRIGSYELPKGSIVIGAGNRALARPMASALVNRMLVEEIRALEHPPLSWDAQLAHWFEEFVPAVEKRRTYARASRRQASTPDIPRPGRVRPESLESRPTFADAGAEVFTNTLGDEKPDVLRPAITAFRQTDFFDPKRFAMRGAGVVLMGRTVADMAVDDN